MAVLFRDLMGGGLLDDKVNDVLDTHLTQLTCTLGTYAGIGALRCRVPP